MILLLEQENILIMIEVLEKELQPFFLKLDLMFHYSVPKKLFFKKLPFLYLTGYF